MSASDAAKYSEDNSDPLKYLGLVEKVYYYDNKTEVFIEGLNDNTPEAMQGKLVDLMHSHAKWYAFYLGKGSSMLEQFSPPVFVNEADIQLKQSIAKTFIEVFTKIESALGNRPLEIDDNFSSYAAKLPSKADTIDAFAALYHIFNKDSPHGARSRFLIKEAFKAMELGEIPHAKFSEMIKQEITPTAKAQR